MRRPPIERRETDVDSDYSNTTLPEDSDDEIHDPHGHIIDEARAQDQADRLYEDRQENGYGNGYGYSRR